MLGYHARLHPVCALVSDVPVQLYWTRCQSLPITNVYWLNNGTKVAITPVAITHVLKKSTVSRSSYLGKNSTYCSCDVSQQLFSSLLKRICTRQICTQLFIQKVHNLKLGLQHFLCFYTPPFRNMVLCNIKTRHNEI